MKVAIAGAGNVGVSIATELVGYGHEVLLIDRDSSAADLPVAAKVDILIGDACEIQVLEQAELQEFGVMIAATGDDKANLVVSLLAKTEYGVPRVVARVNHPKNEWLFDERWGVDVAVSTPRILSALVEEAVSVGDLVRLFSFEHGSASLVEFTIPVTSSLIGRTVGEVTWPPDTTLVSIIRADRVITPSRDDTLEAGDEALFVTTSGSEGSLRSLLSVETSS